MRQFVFSVLDSCSYERMAWEGKNEDKYALLPKRRVWCGTLARVIVGRFLSRGSISDGCIIRAHGPFVFAFLLFDMGLGRMYIRCDGV